MLELRREFSFFSYRLVQANNHTLPSQSTIGRVIANDKDKMRITPLRIDRNGKVKPKRKRVFKNPKPKNLKTKPMELWAVDTIQEGI